MGVTDHHPDCDWFCDQYDFECSCGATRPKAPWFDEHARRCDAVRRRATGGATLVDAIAAVEALPHGMDGVLYVDDVLDALRKLLNKE